MNKKMKTYKKALTSSEGFLKATNLVYSASSSLVPSTGDLFNALYASNIDEKSMEEKDIH